MENRDLQIIILAAGKGSRMKSDLPKPLHSVLGKPMINWVIETASKLNPKKIKVVVGPNSIIEKNLANPNVEFVTQKKQLGDGDATRTGLSNDNIKTTLILNADTPLIDINDLKKIIKLNNSDANVLSAINPDPFGKGRIYRDSDNHLKIVEEKDANQEQKKIQVISTGVFAFKTAELKNALKKIDTNNKAGELYLADAFNLMQTSNFVNTDKREQSSGANNQLQLSNLNKIAKKMIIEKHLSSGVIIEDIDSVTIYPEVKINAGTRIISNVTIKGNTKIGSNALIDVDSYLENSIIGDDVRIFKSVIENSKIKNGANIGPMAHVRSDSEIGENVFVGNYVEVARAKIGSNSKIGHLSFVGDATVGKHVNIGAHTTFVNHDGKQKQKTTIGDDAFIGSGSKLVAPLKIGKKVVTAAGSVIVRNIPDKAMGIAREKQTNKENYWDKFKK